MITLNLLLKINLKIFPKGLPWHIFIGPPAESNARRQRIKQSKSP